MQPRYGLLRLQRRWCSSAVVFARWLSTAVFFASDNGAHQEGGHRVDFFDSSGGLRGFNDAAGVVEPASLTLGDLRVTNQLDTPGCGWTACGLRDDWARISSSSSFERK